MEDNWKTRFEVLLLNELSKRAKPIFEKAAAIYSEEVEEKKSACTPSEFLTFLESEAKSIRQTPVWERLYNLKSKYGTLKGVARNEIRQRIADLESPPTDISDLIAAIERSPNYVAFLEGLKLERKISVLRGFQPVKVWRKYDPFTDCLKRAIEDEANPLLGMTPAKLEFAERIAGMIEAQANWKFSEYYDHVDVKFERLSREEERLDYLEGQRKIFQNSPVVVFFDRQVYHIERELEQREKIARAVGMEVKPTPEFMNIWQETNRQPALLIERVPYLKQILEGLIEAKKFEFVEQELELRKQSATKEEEVMLRFSPPLISAFQQMFANKELSEALKKATLPLQGQFQLSESIAKAVSGAGLEISRLQLNLSPFFEGIRKAFEEIQKVHKDIGGRIAQIGQRWEEVKAQTKESYERQYVSLIHYLEGHHYIIPADYKEFADWYFLVKHGDGSFSDLLKHWPEVSPADFREFHEYKEGLFLQTNEIVIVEKLIQSPIPAKMQLPEFEEAIKYPDKLPELFKRLAEMDNAFINEHGKIIGGRKARKHREVMALAQLISRWIRDGYGQFEAYSMLCKKVGLNESGRSDKITNRPGYDDIRLMLLAELKDLLK